jgi:uncharacterized repeat protein (TIGR03803 family)
VFKVTLAGTLATLHAFVAGGTEGNYPEAGLVLGTDGNFYGTTSGGGANGYGTVFKITPAGMLATLYSFNGTDVGNPEAGLVLGTDGNFFGTTTNGGTGSFGTVFTITPAGTLTTLHNFDGLMVPTLGRGWFRAPTATSTAQQRISDPIVVARSSKSHQRAS